MVNIKGFQGGDKEVWKSNKGEKRLLSYANTKNEKEVAHLRVAHFEIPADDPERAKKFYQDVFGWKIEKWEGPTDYWLITTGPEGEPGIDGGLMKRENPQQGTVNTINVPSADEFVDKIVKAGGNVVVPKMTVPGVGYMAYCQDTEGNTFGIMEIDESAQ